MRLTGFRRATAFDAEQLTVIAQAAKAHWGYPKEWLEIWRDDLTFTPEYIAQHPVIVATDQNEISGFVAIEPWQDNLQLAHFWISPAHMSKGVGRALFAQALHYCETTSCRKLRVVSDPNASGFYEAMGCQFSAFEETKIRGRRLPVYHYFLNSDKAG